MPISSHNHMAGVKFQEGMNISHITNKPTNYLSKRINARQTIANANASMLNTDSPGFLNEIKIRESNDSAAPNITIYQKFKVSIGDHKGRTNRFKINQSVGINNSIKNRKQSVRESFESKRSINQKIISSVDSGDTNEHSIVAPPISIRNKRKVIGKTKGSNEERSNKLESLKLEMNNTIHNFSTMINPQEVYTNRLRNNDIGKNNNQITNTGSIKLSPINNKSIELKKIFQNSHK